MILTNNSSNAYEPHPAGLYQAVCVDLIELGKEEEEFNGEKKVTEKLRLFFETEHTLHDGRKATVSKKFTASINPKSNLAKFIGTWRGREVAEGESIDTLKLIGASATLLIQHRTSKKTGRIYADIAAASKPTKKLTPSGNYDPVATRERIAQYASNGAAIAPAQPAQAPVVTAPASPAKVAAAIPPKPKAAPVQEVVEDDVPF